MTRTQLIGTGVIAFALALIVQAPMPVLYGWLAPKESKIELYGLQGSVLHGSVAGIGMQGKPAWQELHWTLRPLHLLTGRLVADVETSMPAVVKSRVAMAPWGKSLSGVHASGSLRALLSAVGQGYLPIEGQMTAELDSVSLSNNLPTAADGTLLVEGLSWTLAKDPVVLGNFRATAATENDQIQLKVESVSGPLDVSGSVNVDREQAYTVDLRVKLKPDANQMVQTLVRSLGQPDPQGYYHIKRQGKLA
jgi:general secretion pathway protein N